MKGIAEMYTIPPQETVPGEKTNVTSTEEVPVYLHVKKFTKFSHVDLHVILKGYRCTYDNVQNWYNSGRDANPLLRNFIHLPTNLSGLHWTGITIDTKRHHIIYIDPSHRRRWSP